MQLLRLLADGRFHSGEELGALLGISRSAVWKQLQLLHEMTGLALFKVRGKGYRLEHPISLLSTDALFNRLPNLQLHIEERVDSTNAMAMRLLAKQEPPLLVLAEAQTAGRGRRGRQWCSPYGANLYFSLAIGVDRSATQLQALSLVAGVAVLRVLRRAGVPNIGLKWPNDLLAGGKKIAGILLELSGDPADICNVVIGVGINANMLSGSDIDQAWTSILLETKHQVDRTELAIALAEEFRCVLALHRDEGFSAFHEEWEANHLWQGREVRLISGVHEVAGIALGVTGDGALRLQVDDEEQIFSGGELSLRLQHDS